MSEFLVLVVLQASCVVEAEDAEDAERMVEGSLPRGLDFEDWNVQEVLPAP